MAVQAGLVEGQGSEEISSEMYTEEDRFWWDSRKKELKKHRFNASAIRAYLFHQSKLWRYFVSLAMYIHLLLIFVEPDTTPSTSEAQAWLVVEGCCILVYVLDTVVKLFHMGFRDYIHNPMSVSFAILIVLMFVDWVGTVSQWPVLRFSRPLRPFLIVFESSHLRRVMLVGVASLFLFVFHLYN
ncbi:tpcn2 [Symbiodinium sp. KB8]|nr:tpcn2 [Symbiodinium sp. KB8]